MLGLSVKFLFFGGAHSILFCRKKLSEFDVFVIFIFIVIFKPQSYSVNKSYFFQYLAYHSTDTGKHAHTHTHTMLVMSV